MKIEWHFRCTDFFGAKKFNLKYISFSKIREIRAPKVPFNFQFKIEMEKDIFANFNFDSKLEIEKRFFIFNFQFLFEN